MSRRVFVVGASAAAIALPIDAIGRVGSKAIAEKFGAAVNRQIDFFAGAVALEMRSMSPTAERISGYASAGGLMSYAAKRKELVSETAAPVDQSFSVGKPSDIPVRQPSKFAMAIKLMGKKALRNAVLPMLPAQPDGIVE
jgi:hypothetical protein